jgi:hypothetical protein
VCENLKDISEEEIKKAIQSEDCSIQDYLVLVKMLFAKKGVPLSLWEELFHEREIRQKLKQCNAPEDIVIDFVSCWIRLILDWIYNPDGSEESCKPAYFLNFNMHDKLNCAVCHREPYKALSFGAYNITGKFEEFYVTVLCKDHFQRIENNDMELEEAIVDTARQYKEIGIE